jgi:hypothetical protein
MENKLHLLYANWSQETMTDLLCISNEVPVKFVVSFGAVRPICSNNLKTTELVCQTLILVSFIKICPDVPVVNKRMGTLCEDQLRLYE